MPFSLVHLSDPHFGEDADLHKIVAVEHLVPDLQPDAVVISGDLTERARHGEFQAARAWIREIERTAPVLVVPGDHDTQWWKRPFARNGHARSFENYRTYFGPIAASQLQLTDALIAGVSTSSGGEWRQAIKDPKNAARRGRLDRAEAHRIRDLMARAEPHQARVAVMHHHAIDLGQAARNALSNASQAIQWLDEAEVDIILCGHAHQHRADTLHDMVVSVAGTVSTRTPDGIASSFHRIVIEGDSVQVELYLWERDDGRFRRTDVSVFPRHRAQRDHRLATGTL